MSIYDKMTVDEAHNIVDECGEYGYIDQYTIEESGAILDGYFTTQQIAAVLCLLENNEPLRGEI